MNTTGDNLPVGFQGPIRAWSSLVPTADRALRLPHDDGAPDTDGEELADLIEVRAVTESMGRVETAMAGLAARLADAGTLLLEVDNLQSMPMLHLVLEGRPGAFDPAGSIQDPVRFLPLRRVLGAVEAAGLHVVDVVRVPAPAREVDATLARDLLARGLLPIDWLEGPPPASFWLVCRRQPMLAGSVLIAGGSASERQRTADLVGAFLPADWEIVTSTAHRECAQWNRAVAEARGELVWFLRAGCEPTAELFGALQTQAVVGPAVPGEGDDPSRPGDIAGLMMARRDVLLVGPMSEAIVNTPIAIEEFGMRLGSKLPSMIIVELSLPGPGPEPDDPALFAAETATLLQRWASIEAAGTQPATAASVTAAKPLPPVPWSGRRPRVSLCMIARNEEHFLPECLARARVAVDEIVIVDTGSTDRTVAIAESCGARVLHEPWQDDFSTPRNTGIAAATGDWILVLDADEFLAPGAAERIRELVECPDVSGYHMRFTNIYSTGKTIGVMMVRLFRNLPGVRYENIIHEQVSPSLQRAGAELGLVLSAADVEVEHHGYCDEVMDARGKNERNERLFRKQMAAHPDDIYTHYKYGDFLRRVAGRGDDARRLLGRCLELILAGPPNLPRELPYAGEVAALYALETARTGDTAAAGRIVEQALRRFMPTPNLFYLAACLALAEGRTEDAIACYRRCLAYRGQVLVVPIQEGITSYVSLAGIAQCLMQRGDRERARQLLEQAIAIEPGYEVAHLALSRLWLEGGDCQRALQVLTTFLAEFPDSPGACQQTTLILHRLGQTPQARRMGTHAVQLLEARALDHEAAEMNRFLAAM
ncbi:MAG: glycosyltransferase [Planctomycetes bacterium]|nr:glycosyltransferase [Planctomycetota bacterium]